MGAAHSPDDVGIPIGNFCGYSEGGDLLAIAIDSSEVVVDRKEGKVGKLHGCLAPCLVWRFNSVLRLARG